MGSSPLCASWVRTLRTGFIILPGLGGPHCTLKGFAHPPSLKPVIGS